jgi:hypothetical protein
MQKYRPPDNPFRSKGFSFTENNLVTKLYHTSGLDLTIEQTDQVGKSTYLHHYSSPGIEFFTGLLKFLYVHKLHIPKIQETLLVHDEFRGDAKCIGLQFASTKFPLSYQYYPTEGAIATMQPFYEEFKPLLEIKMANNEIIVIYPELAQKIIISIPLLYPGYDSFNIAYNEFLRRAKNHPEQLVGSPPFIRRRKTEQLEFEFVENHKTARKPRQYLSI